MSNATSTVSTLFGLTAALGSDEINVIKVFGKIAGVPQLLLKPGCTLRGTPGAALTFNSGCDGLAITADNVVEDMELSTDPQRRAIYFEAPSKCFGHLKLARLRTVGCVRLIAEGEGNTDEIDLQDIHIIDAASRGFADRPAGFGVEIVPAAFTILSRQRAPGSHISAKLRNISAGSPENPIKGTGILVGGRDGGSELIINVLETGGVFVVQGALVAEVRNMGPVTTYGPNDMVLDNWGRVERWTALAKMTSYGPSSIGFVNLGQLGTLSIDAVMETHGMGSCGFNSGEVKEPSDAASGEKSSGSQVEAGTVQEATFERIVTRGDVAIGIQISVPAGRIVVRKGVETFGGVRASLARGVVTKLAAVALCVKPGGAAGDVDIEGGLITHGQDVQVMELGGPIGTLHVSGEVGPAWPL